MQNLNTSKCKVTLDLFIKLRISLITLDAPTTFYTGGFSKIMHLIFRMTSHNIHATWFRELQTSSAQRAVDATISHWDNNYIFKSKLKTLLSPKLNWTL